MTPELAVMFLQLSIKYGPTVIEDIKTVISNMSKSNVTVEQIDELFATVKTPESFGIIAK